MQPADGNEATIRRPGLAGRPPHRSIAWNLTSAPWTPHPMSPSRYPPNVPSASPFSSGAGRSHVLAISTCLPSLDASRKPCMMSST